MWIGAWLLPYVPVAGLRNTLAIVLSAAALGVLSKAGVPMSPFALVGIPLALAVVSVIVHRRHLAADEPAPRPALHETSPSITEREFAQHVNRHKRELHVHCYRMLGSFEEAEDLVQETFLRAWRLTRPVRGRPDFRAWLYRIATNACLDHIRRKGRRARRCSSFAEIPWLQPYPDRLLDEVAPRERRAGRGRRRARDDRARLPRADPVAPRHASARC